MSNGDLRMTTAASALPHWDMTVIYPGLDSPEFAAGFSSAVEGINELAALFDNLGVGRREPAALDDATVDAVDRVIERFNAVLDETRTLGSYISSFVATD